MKLRMKWASAISAADHLETAITEAAAAVRARLSTDPAHLVLAFASAHHRALYPELPRLVRARLPEALLLGCSSGGVIGAGRELEDQPALSLTAASLPGVVLTPLHLGPADLPQDQDPESWQELVGLPQDPPPHFLLLPDPFTCDPDALLGGLDAAYPGGRQLGGLCSGARGPGQSALWLGDHCHRAGVVGVALQGDVRVDMIVAQGCRPIGTPLIVTRCERNTIYELSGRPAVQVLTALYHSLPAADQELLRRSLFLGIEMRDQVELGAGDFLIRNILGMEPRTGTILVGGTIRPLQAVQFHLRDAHTSADDLRAHLLRCAPDGVAGALMFSCLGRGQHLYGRPDHDSELVRERLGADLPLGGFFCNGEIGPVGGTTFLHGYTSAIGLFRPAQGGEVG